MKTFEFVSYLQNIGVKLWIDKEQLGCQAPKGVITPELRQDILERKTEILEFLRKARTNKEPLATTIKKIPRDGKLLLSFAQERLWFINQLFPDNSSYNQPIALNLKGPLNVVALEQSLKEIIQRHETLRTSFPEINGQPVQIVAPVMELPLTVVDLQSSDSTHEQSEKVKELVRQEAIATFDLANGPVLQVTLLQLESEHHVLLIKMHHIISDGWSLGILVREFSTLYDAFAQGKLPALPELPIQYADFGHWQREWLTGEVLEKQLNYWRKQLSGISPILDIPTDYPRPTEPTFKGGMEYFQLDSYLTQKLKQLSQESGSTLFMTLLAAFFVLLSRYSNQSDLVVGSPIANRNRREIEPLIGMFVNTLVLRANLADNPTFRELLARVQKTTLDAYTYQDLPFEKLLEELQTERNLSHNALVQVMFAVQNNKMEAWNLPGLEVSQTEFDFDFTRFDLEVHCGEVSSGIAAFCIYNTDIFKLETISRMMRHFQTLLEAVVANPEQKVLQLPLMKSSELHQILVEWNNTKTDYPRDKCIHQLFEEQVEKTPDAVAVVFEDKQLTYSELNSRANQLAHYLQTLGVKPEVLVGICVERSLLMIVGLLGILKAGGAYVPLDPNYPSERLAYMLSDAGVSVLLTQQSLVASLPEHQAEVVCLDNDWETIANQGIQNPPSKVTAENLAYVIYTSGSTGTPKGILICHQSVVNFLVFINFCPGLTESDTLNAITTISFDIAALELYLPLIVGAKLVVVPREIATDGYQLLPQLWKSQATVMQGTPATWQMLLTSGLSEQKPKLKVLCGGEALSVQLAHELLETGSEVWNLYGPTEATIWSTIYQLGDESKPGESGNVITSIGRPIANTQIYILDSNTQPVPIGVLGELHIGGDGLARGYLNRPELTAEKFIPNPFENNSKLYKTGDLGRYLPDGNIEFIGRIDHQVKIRGYRIETGEIEATLNQHPTVKETVVLAREDNPGEKRLVAYIVSEDNSLSTSDFREFLQQKLPDYMVPSAFVILEALPLTPNGKVERKALPAPEAKLEGNFILPRDPVERQLAQIWSEVLNVYPIGVQDNFFDLGGHSLIAVRLMSQIEKQFGKNLPLATIFKGQTIEQLATILRESTDSISWSALVPIQPNGSKRPFFLVPGGGGNVVYYSYLARYLSSDQPFYGLQAIGLDGESEPFTRIEDMAAHNIQEIQSIQPQGPYLLGGHSFGGAVALEMAQQLQKQGQKVALLAILDTTPPEPENKVLSLGWNDATWMTYIGKFLGHLFGKELNVSYETLERLTPDDQFNYLYEQLQQINFFPPGAGINQLSGFVRVFKANSMCSYFPQEIYPTPITLFRCIEHYPEEVMDKELFESLSVQNMSLPDFGWSPFSSRPLEIYDVPGDHISMVAEPHVQVLAQKLMACIEKAQVKDK
ncbi:amino acid adenylation domain-containing protein [Moorena sp. SIO3B2]|uniref:amino acid adenylation domain-containing protein n=1 Tax=Moorena sp. SIO3B2 TaxID=2607827 RepID=UPI0013C75FF1|nr:amino acid adenylation domain-containing protein [Moorena sp. SIO3B2]NEP33690.1 amino acid adenylation domain-containing protein [Moorena sp. SIO3B2]